MLFTCLPPGTPIPGRFPGPAHARGKWFTVDIHCHIRSDKATAMVAGNQDVSRWFLETAADERSQRINRQNGERTFLQGMSAEQRIADMDHMGIDIQALSPAPRQTYYGADPDLGLATARVLNDEIAAMCARYPDRFTGLGTVPFQAPELALAELDRLHKSLGFRGIEIMTHVAGEDLSEPRFRKIFARCEELGLLVFMHPDGFTEARRFKDHYFANVIGNPLDSTVAVHHLIFGGVLEDHPNLKIVVAHGGGYLPAYSGRIDHAASARPDEGSGLDRGEEARLVIPDVADRLPDWIGAHLLRRIGLEQRQELVGARLGFAEPERPGRFRQDHWHPLMDRPAQRVGEAGDDGKAAQDAAVGRVPPALPQPGKGEDVALERHDRIGPGLPALFLPFVEAVGRDEAAAPFEG